MPETTINILDALKGQQGAEDVDQQRAKGLLR